MAPASQEPVSDAPSTTTPDGKSLADNVSKAYRDLLRGEQAATALEANLTNLENRLDAILAAFEASEEPQKTRDNSATIAKDDDLKEVGAAAAHSKDTNGQNDDPHSNATAKET